MARKDDKDDRLRARMAALHGARGTGVVGGSTQPDAKAASLGGRSERAGRRTSRVKPDKAPGGGLTILILILLIVAGGLVLATLVGKGLGPPGQQSAAPGSAAGDPKAEAAALGAAETVVAKALRARAPLSFTNVFVKDVDVPIVCGYVQARGKKAGPSRAFIVTGAQAAIDVSHAAAFSRAWNDKCLGMAAAP
jgi:hypothetical protein